MLYFFFLNLVNYGNSCGSNKDSESNDDLSDSLYHPLIEQEKGMFF